MERESDLWDYFGEGSDICVVFKFLERGGVVFLF